MSLMRSAMQKYDMISGGDRIAVGVSGGKDSVALLYALAQMRKFYPAEYSVIAVTLDPCFFNKNYDYSEITALCDRLGVEHIIRRTQLWEIIFERRHEENPCSLCARMRRGILHEMAKTNNCNKIALGHHLDDAVETFYMNVLNGGNIACFSPVTYLSRRDLTLIRPMIYATEAQVAGASRRESLPVVKSVCPADGITNRQQTKELIRLLDNEYHSVREKTIGAMERGNIDGWHL